MALASLSLDMFAKKVMDVRYSSFTLSVFGTLKEY